MHVKVTLRAMILAFFLMLVAWAAQAQDAITSPPPPTDLMGWAALIASVLVPVTIIVLGVVAPMTKTKIDDQILDMVKRWADPSDDAVPPSPTNPEGKS